MKLQHLFYAAAMLAVAHTAQAQVKVGDNPATINAGSALEVESTNKGLLMPRISLTATTTWGLAGTPAAGMSVYNTNAGISSSNTSYPASGVGEYYWDGTGWVSKKGGAAGGTVAADNGLTVGYNSAGSVGLGGTLAKTTEVAQNGFNLNFTGNTATDLIGIGTATPNNKLTVLAPSSSTIVASFDNGGGINTPRGILMRNNAAGAYFGYGPTGNNQGPKIVAGQGKNIGFFTENAVDAGTAIDPENANNLLRMIIMRATGNVGIGTTDPGAKLEVNNGTTAGAIKLVDGTQGAGKVLTSDANGLATWQTPVSGGTVAADNGLTVGYNSAGNVGLGGTLAKNTTIAQGSNSLTFSGASNVNIATTNSSVYPLAITQPLQTAINQPGLVIGGASGTAATNQAAFIGLNPNNSQGGWPISIGAQYISGSSGQGAADFFIATSNGGAADKKLVLKNGTGYVGIGTTAPGAKLEVNNGGTAGAIKLVDGTQGAGKVLTSDANGLATWQTPVSGGSGSTYTASNGLTMSGTNVKLGGAITELTTISGVTSTNKLSVTGTGVDAVNIDGTTLSVDASNNRVGIGTAAPAYRLDIDGGNATAMRIANGGDLQFTADFDNTKGVTLYCGSSNTSFSFVGFGTGASNASINLTTGAVTGSSDARLKENIHTINDVTSRLMKLRPVTYNYKTDKATVAPGLIAQEVDKVFPDVVVRPKTEKDYYAIYYQYFTPYLIKGFQEQQAQIEILKAENAKLTAQVAELAELKLAVADIRRELVKVAVRKVNVTPKGGKVAKR